MRVITYPIFARAVVLIAGATYTLVGAALLIAPVWFFHNIGPFPPFNRHYTGDVGAFVLPLGISLLLMAERNLFKLRALIGSAASASVLHALNHVYDSVIGHASLAQWRADTLPLMALDVLLALIVSLSSEHDHDTKGGNRSRRWPPW